MQFDSDGLLEQRAIEESLRDHHPRDGGGTADATALAVNAQVSDALLRSRPTEEGPQVAVLKFSRTPKAFGKVLSKSPELARLQRALVACGSGVVLKGDRWKA